MSLSIVTGIGRQSDFITLSTHATYNISKSWMACKSYNNSKDGENIRTLLYALSDKQLSFRN
jgi:hypothetical protein